MYSYWWHWFVFYKHFYSSSSSSKSALSNVWRGWENSPQTTIRFEDTKFPFSRKLLVQSGFSRPSRKAFTSGDMARQAGGGSVPVHHVFDYHLLPRTLFALAEV